MIRETHLPDLRSYIRHVRILALLYFTLFMVCLAGIVLIVWQGRLFIVLSQRSNVETLTLAFFLLLYFYVATLSAPGVWGALKIAFTSLCAGAARENLKEKWICRRRSRTCVALNLVVESEKAKCDPFRIAIEDEHSRIGELHFDGARLTHIDFLQDGSHTLFVFVIQQIRLMLNARGARDDLDIVEWRKLDSEETDKYLCQVEFARNLERHLGREDLWPKVVLKEAEVAKLKRTLTEACPILRSESMLPDWEYAGEHKLPIIPEPLGIISLSRVEKRVDPVASMSSALLILSLSLVAFILLILFPPWVPSV
jgi:hypothetical protein